MGRSITANFRVAHVLGGTEISAGAQTITEAVAWMKQARTEEGPPRFFVVWPQTAKGRQRTGDADALIYDPDTFTSRPHKVAHESEAYFCTEGSRPTPPAFLSRSQAHAGKWLVFVQGVGVAQGSRQEVLQYCSRYAIELPAIYWDGLRGKFEPYSYVNVHD